MCPQCSRDTIHHKECLHIGRDGPFDLQVLEENFNIEFIASTLLTPFVYSWIYRVYMQRISSYTCTAALITNFLPRIGNMRALDGIIDSICVRLHAWMLPHAPQRHVTFTCAGPLTPDIWHRCPRVHILPRPPAEQMCINNIGAAIKPAQTHNGQLMDVICRDTVFAYVETCCQNNVTI